jgi:hypothetical protein
MRTSPVELHSGHNLAEKTDIAPNCQAQARVKATMTATVQDPVSPGTNGDLMPTCRIIFVDIRRIKEQACLYTALGLQMGDRRERWC